MKSKINLIAVILIGTAMAAACNTLEVTMPKGPQGEQGVQGVSGKDGLSAYEIWVESIKDKTVSDWSGGTSVTWSRSRKALWTKGESSGNYLHVEKIYADCDADTLLITARPDGPTCHRGTVSCFDTPPEEGFLGRLERVISSRH